jgi:hypothetical protein
VDEGAAAQHVEMRQAEVGEGGEEVPALVVALLFVNLV